MLTCCATCGTAYERDTGDSKCPECRPTERQRNRYTPKRTARSVGYDSRWDRLSRKAREQSPFCQRCGTSQDLTVDHTPEAWERVEAGKVIRLCDVVVLCRSCNSSAGPARGDRVRRSRRPQPLVTDYDDTPPPF